LDGRSGWGIDGCLVGVRKPGRRPGWWCCSSAAGASSAGARGRQLCGWRRIRILPRSGWIFGLRHRPSLGSGQRVCGSWGGGPEPRWRWWRLSLFVPRCGGVVWPWFGGGGEYGDAQVCVSRRWFPWPQLLRWPSWGVRLQAECGAWDCQSGSRGSGPRSCAAECETLLLAWASQSLRLEVPWPVWCTPRGDAGAVAPGAWWWSFPASGREGGGVGSRGRRGSGP
jgi:hypothetical protein